MSCKDAPCRRKRLSFLLAFLLVLVTLLATGAAPQSAAAQEAQWIWSPRHEQNAVPQTSCYFRKTFQLSSPESGQILVAADDRYELYVNGRRIGSGESSQRLDRYDISNYLARGDNLVAIRAQNTHGNTAALAARVMVKESGKPWAAYSTDATWKSHTSPLPLWYTELYNDSRWQAARAFGRLGDTAPWDRQEHVATEEQHRGTRFRISEEFEVQRVIAGEDTGSLIAMAFNEFGQIIASQENGPLYLIYDDNRPETPRRLDDVRVYCDLVKNCQGILALNGEVFVTADGPEGAGLYRLSDPDQDGKLDKVVTLIKFKGAPGEHGAHGVVLGPDGLLYVVLGNHVQPDMAYNEASPLRNVYEGDLVQPRYEDPSGHAAGVKAPGGVVLRTDIEGHGVQLVAGGLRNAYDLAFNEEGELFVHDSDMESNLGTTWYCPTRLYHVLPGADFGWRSGWAKWPEHFVDVVPPVCETGRGSPTGAVFYNHFMFPARYHGALFTADWSEGRILAIHLKKNGASYTAEPEVFLEGQPLNVTDLEVGPDGWLYFITGGRNTRGGLYRVTWKGKVPEQVRNLGEGIASAVRQPQLQSGWSRQRIAERRQSLGGEWERLLVGVASTEINPAQYRTRALDLLQLFGPSPGLDLLLQLSKAQSEAVRAKTAEVMGLHATPATQETLITLLNDSDRRVRRKACEALLRSQANVPVDPLLPLLASDDRAESWAARRLLERMPTHQWRDTVLASKDQRVFIQGALALIVAEPTQTNALAVISRTREWMDSFISDRNFVDMLRVLQVTLHRVELPAEMTRELRDQLASEFPSGDAVINRELARLLVHLQADAALPEMLAYLRADQVSEAERLHVALHLRYLTSGWTASQKMQLLNYYETAITSQSGNVPLFVMNVTRDFARLLNDQERRDVLLRGSAWPNAALGALTQLPARLSEEDRAYLKELDEQIAAKEGDAYQRLRLGIVAVLGRSADEDSMAYLREIWAQDPERRAAAAMALAQDPTGENWDVLLRSLPGLEGNAAQEVLTQLSKVDRKPDSADAYRHVILLGLRLGENGSKYATQLLEHWAGEQVAESGASWEDQLAAWQDWFRQTYPEAPAAEMPVASGDSKWEFDELLAYLNSSEASAASAHRGAAVFEKAQCAKCHRFDGRGEQMGPDLTSVGRRFTRREVLESIIYPSQVISDQYASQLVITEDGKSYSGLVVPGAAGELIVLQANGEKVTVKQDDVEQLVPSKTSAMPTALLDSLTIEEIADLFAYLMESDRARVTRRTISDRKKN